MRLSFLLGLISFFTIGSLQLQAQEKAFFSQADKFFNKFVTNGGMVHYQKLHEDPAPLKQLTNQIAHADFDALEGAKLKAFYINAYNLLTIQQVVKHYPIASPNDVPDFFDGIEHQVAGKSMTLNQLEKKTLFQQFPDARMHFALVCAAKGCPPLWPHAYQPDQLDEQLTKITRRALMDDEFIRVNAKNRIVRISKIFKWYKQDFLKASSSLLGYINDHRPKQLAADSRVRYYAYNWDLNAVRDAR